MDVVMLSLRTARGLDLKRAIPIAELNTMLSNEKENEIGSRLAYIRLSDPEGFLLSNELISHSFGIIDP
ncbi:hypothetical protein ACOSQ3_014163 [Xanthoceras sorbifolium]